MAFRSSASAISATGGTLTATPSGVTAGDYLMASWNEALSAAGGVSTLSTPTGWTLRLDLGGGSGGGGSSGVQILDVDSYVAQTFSFSGGANQTVLVTAAWSGRNTSAPRRASASNAYTTQQASPVIFSLTGAIAAANDDVAVFTFGDQNTGTDRWSSNEITNYTRRQNTFAIDWVSHSGLQTRDAVIAGSTGSLPVVLTRTTGTDTSGRSGAVFIIAAPTPAAPDNTTKTATLGQWDPELRIDAWW